MEVIVDTTKGVYKERIVRCKECKYRNRCSTVIVFGDPERITDAFSIEYCSYGEREGE